MAKLAISFRSNILHQVQQNIIQKKNFHKVLRRMSGMDFHMHQLMNERDLYVIAFIAGERSRNGNKIYVANNKLCEMNKNLPRETLKFNKLLYFAWAFYGKIKTGKRRGELFIFQIA